MKSAQTVFKVCITIRAGSRCIARDLRPWLATDRALHTLRPVRRAGRHQMYETLIQADVRRDKLDELRRHKEVVRVDIHGPWVAKMSLGIATAAKRLGSFVPFFKRT